MTINNEIILKINLVISDACPGVVLCYAHPGEAMKSAEQELTVNP
ncbi:hypothetical protein [Microseira sp. BLCC-F43]|jgi:hypothetical protein